METTTTTTTSTTEEDETAIDVIAKDDELLKRILHRTFSPAPNLHSPITPVDLPNAYFAQFAIKDLAEATRTESDDMAAEDDDGDDSKSSTLPTTTSSSSPHLFHNNTDLNHSCNIKISINSFTWHYCYLYYLRIYRFIIYVY